MMMRSLSRSMQDYVKAIYLLTRNGAASTTDIATRLSIAPASVTAMLKRLSELQLVHYESYRGVELTHAGVKIALELIRHHRLLELYLAEALGYSWDKVHDEAEQLEHHISEEFEDRIATILGDPSYDPHGDPIPTKDGRMPPTVTERLADANVRETVVIRRVNSHDRQLLQTLAEEGVGLHTSVRVLERNDEGGLTIAVGRKKITLSRKAVENIYVERPAAA